MCLWVLGFSNAQKDIQPTYEVETVSVGSNLASLQINKLFQDRAGYIWLGTDMGLARFDGISFKNYNFAHGTKIAAIYDILEDHQGQLWAGGEKGLFYLHEDQFIQAKIPESSINALMLDQNKNLHIGGLNFTPKVFTSKHLDSLRMELKTEGHEVVKNKKWNEKFKSNTVWEMEVDDDGGVWIGLENELLLIENENITRIQAIDNIHTNISEIIPINRDSAYWGNETTGLFFKDEDSIKMIMAPITYIMERTDSSLYFLTPMELIKYENQKYDTLSTLDSHDHLYFKDMIIDEEGIVWIATEGSLLKLSRAYFHSWTLEDSKLLGSNHSITQTDEGDILIGSSKKEILLWKKGQFEPYKQIPAVFNSTTEAILEEEDGRTWYGTSMSGIIMEYDDTFKTFSEKDGLVDKTVLFLIKDRFDRLWCGGENGVSEIVQNETGIKFNNFEPEIPNHTIPRFIDLLCLPNGTCYASSIHSIYELKDHFLRKIHFPELEQVPLISKVLSYDSNHLLIATLGKGILKVKIDKDKNWILVKSWDTSSGLISSNILNIHLDKENRLWSISQNGVCLIEDEELTCYDKHDAWLPLETTHADLLETIDGKLWIVANSSITVFPLYSLPKNHHLPKVYISDVRLFRDAGLNSNHLFEARKENPLVLSHNQNFIEFAFLSTSFTRNGKNRFTYKLDGLDKQWNPSTSRTSVQYAGLKPGDYTFKVKAINNSGYIGKMEASYPFRILKPWFFRSWALVIYLIALSLLLYVLFNLVNSRKLKILESEKLRSVNDFQNNFYTNISHEFRTPLTVILGMSDQIKEALSEKKINVDQELEMIHRSATNLLTLVNQMLNLSKLKQSKTDFVFVNLDIIGLISQVIESVQAYAKSQSKEILFYSEEEVLRMDVDDQSISILLLNLIAKAIKNTPAKQKIIIHAKREDSLNKFLSIKIRGATITEKSEMKEVASSFHNSSKEQEEVDEEIEIALARQVLQIIGGRLKISIEEKGNCEYQVLLPINNSSRPKIISRDLVPENKSFTKNQSKILLSEQIEGRSEILVIEDNIDVARYIISILEKTFNTRYASNGVEALPMIEIKKPNLILCDIMMPEMDGYEVCQLLKSSKKTKDIPIILLTAKADKNSRILGISKGADGYINKPFSQVELIAKVNQLIEKHQTIKDKIKNENLFSVISANQSHEDHFFLKKATSYILKNIENDIYGPVFLARDLGISESSLYKKLKALSGKSTAVFMRSVRLAKAKEILLKTNSPISDVAKSTGFKNTSWFSRSFKEEFSYPPSELRKDKVD